MAYVAGPRGEGREHTRLLRLRQQLHGGQMFLAGADADGLYLYDPQLGFFKKIGKMFKRAVKFTPKSFRPANIFRAATSTALTAVTGGAYQFLPSKIKKGIENASAAVMPYALGAVAAVVAGPAVISALGPVLTGAASILKTTITAGGTFLSFMGKLNPFSQQQVANQVTPEQVAQMERTGVIPAQYQAYLNQQPASMPPVTSYLPPPPPMPPPQQYMNPEEQAAFEKTEASALGGVDWKMLLIGSTAVGVLLAVTQQPRR